MQTRPRKPELLEEPLIERLARRLQKKKAITMAEADNATQTLMDYLTQKVRENNIMQLPSLA